MELKYYFLVVSITAAEPYLSSREGISNIIFLESILLAFLYLKVIFKAKEITLFEFMF